MTETPLVNGLVTSETVEPTEPNQSTNLAMKKYNTKMSRIIGVTMIRTVYFDIINFI